MQFNEDTGQGHFIRSYEQNGITIGEKRYQRNLIVSPTAIISDWRPQKISEITHEDCSYLFELKPEVVILGTGPKMQIPPIELITLFTQKGIGFEYMDTAAACRTYNLLMAEGRNVVVLLFVGLGTHA